MQRGKWLARNSSEFLLVKATSQHQEKAQASNVGWQPHEAQIDEPMERKVLAGSEPAICHQSIFGFGGTRKARRDEAQ